MTPRNIGTAPVGQCHRRSPRPRPARAAPSSSPAISTAGTSAPARSTTPPAVAIAAAAAKRIMDAGRPLRHDPHRLVRRRGSRACSAASIIARATASEPHYALAESDFGADRVWKVDSQLGEAARGRGAAAAGARSPRSASSPGALDKAEGSDIGPMLADGVPGVDAQPGRHALFRPPPHARRHARQDRPGGAAAECRGVDGDARRAIGRHRAARRRNRR